MTAPGLSSSGSATGGQVPRRVLIVSADIGEGHNATGRALRQAIARTWPGCQVSWLVARLATEFASLRHSGVNSPGLRHFFWRNTWLWAGVFAVLALGFAGLIVTEPITQFLIISTIVTVALVGTAAAVSALWFGVVLRNNGLRLRFASAA